MRIIAMTYDIVWLRKIMYPLLVALTFVVSSESFAVGQDECRSDVVECFENYRKAVASGSPHLAKFFTKEVNEWWLGTLSKNRSSEDQLATLASVKSSLSFSRFICTVHHYEHVRSDGVDLLNIFYTTADGKGPYLYGISYIKQMGFLSISSMLDDTTSATTTDAKRYSKRVIAEFCKE